MSEPVRPGDPTLPERPDEDHLAPRTSAFVRRFVDDDGMHRVRRTVAPLVAGDLGKLARLYGTDKYWRHGYTLYYQRHLPARRDVTSLFEIGVGGYKLETGGESLRMWRSYYPRAQIHGLDIHPKKIDEPRVTIHQGDQTDGACLDEILDQTGPPDVIIDDGSHQQDHIRTTFGLLFHRVRPGGWYVIEDLHTAYMERFGGGEPGMADTSVTLIESLVGPTNQGTKVAELHLYPRIAFIRRP
ncbi:MAG: class I SAM-dependent methyltransferase [Actinomycetota bacterium]